MYIPAIEEGGLIHSPTHPPTQLTGPQTWGEEAADSGLMLLLPYGSGSPPSLYIPPMEEGAPTHPPIHAPINRPSYLR